MLPRQFRLDRKEFEIVKRDGTLRSGRLMGLLVYYPRFTIHYPPSSVKAGLIVSNKLSKKSTERNRLKRRLRAALVRVLPELSRVHVVVLPTRRAMGATVGDLEFELRTIVTPSVGSPDVP